MLSFRVFARLHPRRFVSPLPHDLCGRRLARSKIPTRSGLSTSPSPKSFPAISLADPHLLTPPTSIFYKNRAGRGYVVRPLRPLAATLTKKWGGGPSRSLIYLAGSPTPYEAH